jgi:hypothetical protein
MTHSVNPDGDPSGEALLGMALDRLLSRSPIAVSSRKRLPIYR